MPKLGSSPAGDGDAFASLMAAGPFRTVKDASRAIGASRGKIYALAHEGRLELAKLGGRTLVRTESLVTYLRSAEPWSPSNRAAKANASRMAKVAARQECAA